MRTRLLQLVVLSVALAVIAGPVNSAVQGTAHQTNAGAQGVCSACHIPHGGTAGASSRLWPVAPTTTSTAPAVIIGTVASLCASCHISTGAHNGVTGMSAAFSDQRAYHQTGHGGQMTVADMPPGSSLATSGLPYVTNTTLECTSCHNVHDDVNRPFLRADIDALCARCHSQRNYQSAADSTGSTSTKGQWGGAAYMGRANPGSHPAGTDVTGDTAGTGASPITLAGNFVIAKTSAAGTWSLGGHLADNNGTGNSTGGVTCNSCHAVHGIEVDGGSGATAVPTVNMLVVAQDTGNNEGVTGGRSIASGDGSAGNGLCEACHAGPSPAGYGGTRTVNPGGGTSTHPVDDYAALYNAVGIFNASGAPAQDWPASITASGATGNAAICESCHTPHPRANIARATIVDFATTDNTSYILRDRLTDICADCHTSLVTQHHPVGQNIASAKSGAASYLPGGNTLTCATCHGGGAGGAHNWAGRAQVTLASGWKPADNGRAATAAAYRFNAATSNVSSTCIDCHLDLDNDAANISPTMHNSTAGVNTTDNTNYTNLGQGSHYIGPVAAGFFGNKAIPGADRQTTTNFNAFTDNWTTTVFGAGNAAAGISRFGGSAASPILVCESCHNLVPTRNVGAHMLLSSFYEGQSSVSGVRFDTFCEGCHGVPTGTHQQTTDNVARTGAQLNTTVAVATRPWLAANAPAAQPAGGAQGTSTWFTGAAGTGQVTCESCHQVHDANTASASLIVEAPAANVTGGSPVNITSANYYGNATISKRLRQQAPAGGTAGVGTMPDVSIFCDQCHTYRGQ